MTGDGARAGDDAADFLDFAAARQGPALRAATLVTADDATGYRVALEALQALAGDWDRAREDGPDRRLRTALFRDAVARTPAPVEHGAVAPVRPAAALGAAEDPRPPDDLDRVRDAVAAGLGDLPARARAVAVLRWLEDRADPETAAVLGEDLAVVLDDVEDVRRMLAAVRGPGPALPDDDEARGLVELVADQVHELDLARPAWDGARARRHRVRRRSALAGGALVVGGVAAAVLVPDRGGAPRPSPLPTRTTLAGRLQTVAVGGATAVLAPEPVGFAGLADYPDAPRLGLPERFGPGSAPLDLLSPAGSQGEVRAVYLVRVGDDAYQPVVLVPGPSTDPLAVAMAPLHRTADPDADLPIALGPSTIAPDRHRIVFPQPGAVVVLEVRSARTRRIEVPDEGIVSAGWAGDGLTVVARSASTGWLVDSRTGKVVRSARRVNAGATGIGVDGGPVTIRVYSERGQLMILRRVPGPDLDPYGESASTSPGWVCSGTFFGELAAAGNRFQGLVAVQVARYPSPRILAASTAPGVPLKTFRPLAWGPQHVVILQARTLDGGTTRDTVLAWDVPGDRLFRVGTVQRPPADQRREQAFTGAWAL